MPSTNRTDDPISVFENHAGPIRNAIVLPTGHLIAASSRFAYVAYRDAERDALFYGYGGTREEAVADYLRQICEETCSNCGCDGTRFCNTASDCCLAFDHFHTLLNRELDALEASNSTHAEWRDLNKES